MLGALPLARWFMRLFPHIGAPYNYSPSPLSLLRAGHFHQSLTLALFYLTMPLVVFSLCYLWRPDPVLAKAAATGFLVGHLLCIPKLIHPSREAFTLFLGLCFALSPALGITATVLWVSMYQMTSKQLSSQLAIVTIAPLVAFAINPNGEATLLLLVVFAISVYKHASFIFNFGFKQESTSTPVLSALSDETKRFLKI